MERGPFDSRHPLVGLVDETIRLNSRLRSVFGAARQESPLNDSEQMVLNAVVEAEKAPTVAQIGRSMGQARQLVQRAANALRAQGLVEAVPNPDHKRAVLLRATARGTQVKRALDRRADAIATRLGRDLDEASLTEAAGALRSIRRDLEAVLRAMGS